MIDLRSVWGRQVHKNGYLVSLNLAAGKTITIEKFALLQTSISVNSRMSALLQAVEIWRGGIKDEANKPNMVTADPVTFQANDQTFLFSGPQYLASSVLSVWQRNWKVYYHIAESRKELGGMISLSLLSIGVSPENIEEVSLLLEQIP